MTRTMTRILTLLQRLEDRPYHPARLLFVVLAVGIGRTVEEIVLGQRSLGLNIASHYGTFYLATFFCFNAVAATVLKIDWRKTSQFVLYGILIGLLPPLIDVIWRGPGKFRYNYLDGFYPTLHGAGNPSSEAIAAWSALGAFVLYLSLRGRSFWRALTGLGLAYAALLLLVSLTPDFLKDFLSPIKTGTVKTFLYLIISYLIYVGLNFERFKPSLKRINHSLPWVLLVFLGAVLAGGVEKMTWLQAVLVLFVHQGVVFANDYYDRVSDTLNKRTGGIDQDDVFLLHAILLWIAVHVCLMNPKLGFFYLLYLLLTTAYHHPRLRLKDVFPLNYAMEGLVAALALLIGMASSDRAQLGVAELLYVVLAFAGFAAASPFKDYKDIEGDDATGTQTLYVLLAKRGWPYVKTHRWVTAVVLLFMTAPLLFLYLKKTPLPYLGALAIAFVVPTFFLLRADDKKAAVERTAWLITAYLACLVLALRFAVPFMGPGILKDYGTLLSGSEQYTAEHPSSSEEISRLIRKANQEKMRIRVRGNGHSMNGSSLPRDGELVIFTDRLRRFVFEEPGTLTVEAGVGMSELRTFLNARGYGLPVFPDGTGGPTVGGYIAAGGIGGGSRRYGGFWENVLQITLVTGAGDILKLKQDDALFPWMFGSMGQLGVFVSAKLKILDAETRSYPSGETGKIPELARHEAARLAWFTVFVPKASLEEAKTALKKIKEAHPDAFEYRPDYVYPMTFARFNPKLIFPVDEDFVGVGIWGYPKSSDPANLMDVEKDVAALVKAHEGTPYRRYIQSELVSPETDYRDYFGASLYDEFLGFKKQLDPALRLNCGTVFPCPDSR